MSEDRLRDAIALYDRFTHDGMDRRLFMARLVRIAGGTAAAAALLTDIAACAQAKPQVPADDARLHTTTQTWEVRAGRPLSVYVATPVRGRPRATIVVIHENRGLNDHIRDVARRAALAGYQAVAPDLLTPTGGTPADPDRAREMIGALDLAETVADGTALIHRLEGTRQRARKVAVVGFCWGGGMVHRLAIAAGNSLSAGVSFYGPAPDPAEAPRVSAPLLVLLAGRDERVNRTAEPWVAALRAAGKTVETHTFPNVDHAFNNDTSAARYNREAADQAWAMTLAFFARHLR